MPTTVSFESYDEFQVGDGMLGFQLRQTDGRRARNLGLQSIATFTRIDRRGEVLEILGRERIQISSIKGYETLPISFKVREPGLYRADVVFTDRSGQRLGRYGTYTRLLPLVAQPPRLALNARFFRPGQTVFGRIENFGTTSIFYGAPYSIERWNRSTWITAPESPRGPWIRKLFATRPGGTGACSAFQIPDTIPPGTYRMVKPIRSGADGPLMAKFEIRP
jgi:hypothetical protein